MGAEENGKYENGKYKESEDSRSALPGGADLWITRLVGGGIGGVFIVALWMALPYVGTYLSDYKAIRLSEIQSKIDVCNQQLTACVSDLKESRAELRECKR